MTQLHRVKGGLTTPHRPVFHTAAIRNTSSQLQNIAKMVYSFYALDRRISGRGDQGGAQRSPSRYPGQFSAHCGADQAHGLERIREPYLKHLEGPLWEMRLKGKSGIARAIYITATGMRIVVVHVFAKKTQKTPRKEIVHALKKAKEIQ